jgi:hypothetical protein
MLFHIYPPPTTALVSFVDREVTASRGGAPLISSAASRAGWVRRWVGEKHSLAGRWGHDWGFMKMADAEDTFGPGGMVLGPPMSPGKEPLVTDEKTGVIAHGDLVAKMMEKRGGFRVVRKLVSQNAKYGDVWRADLAGPGSTTADMRLICWKIPGQDDYSILSQPLDMFDPAQSVPPLP